MFWWKVYCVVFIQSHWQLFFIAYNQYLLIIIMEFDSTVWKIEDRRIQIQEFTGKIIGYDNISE